MFSDWCDKYITQNTLEHRRTDAEPGTREKFVSKAIVFIKRKMSDSEASSDSFAFSVSSDAGSTPGSSPGSYQYPSLGWPHPLAAKKIFYTRGVTSHQVGHAAFESTEPELFCAVCDNDVALVEKLLVEKHSCPNAIFRLKIQFEGVNMSYTQYPLHRAVQTCNKNLVDVLLRYGSDPNCTNGQEKTPLQLLFRLIRRSTTAMIIDYSDPAERHPAIIREMLKTDRHFSYPIIMEMLLKAGADMKLDAKTLTHIMSGPPQTYHRWSLLEVLVTAGTDVRDQLTEKCHNDDNDESCVFITLVSVMSVLD